MEESNLMNNPKLYGPCCALSAHGIGFDAELFLSRTTFAADLILGYGKLGMPEQLKIQIAEKEGEEAARLFDATILVLRVSSSGISKIQHDEAIQFLTKYGDEVLRLSKFPNVEQLNLRSTLTQGESFEPHPEDLVQLAVKCGITSLM